MSYKIISKNTQRHNQNGTSNNLRCINPLNANPTKWLNKLKQFVGFYRRIVSFSCHNSPHFFYSIQKRHHCNIKTVRNERCFFYFSLYHKGWNSILLWTYCISQSQRRLPFQMSKFWNKLQASFLHLTVRGYFVNETSKL